MINIMSMENNKAVVSLDGEVSSGYRSPLLPLTSSSVNVPSKSLRHKSSFVVRVDSSEDAPSPHESIFEALCTNSPDNDEAVDKLDALLNEGQPEQEGDVQLDGIGQSDLHNSNHDVVDDSAFLYGHGTVLDTITEQRSCGTMRTQATADGKLELPSFPFARHRDSFALNQQTARRKQAFSHDDIDLIQASYHDACVMIEREARKQLPVHEVYAEPWTPLHEPLERPITPDGMPSWTGSQTRALPARRQPTIRTTSTMATKLRQLLHLRPKPVTNAPLNRSISDPLRNRPMSRFRPPRSVYGNISSHPFATAPMAQPTARAVDSPITSSIRGKNKDKQKGVLGVRFTPSATARDSELNTLITAIESTSNTAAHPIEPFTQHATFNSSAETKCRHRQSKAEACQKQVQINTTSVPPSLQYVAQFPSTQQGVGDNIPQFSPIHSSDRPATPFSFAPSNSSLVMMSNVLRSPSISSTVHLMSGGLQSSPSPTQRANTVATYLIDNSGGAPVPKVGECWKCKLSRAGGSMNNMRKRGSEILVYLCCGYDVRDSHPDEAHVRVSGQ